LVYNTIIKSYSSILNYNTVSVIIAVPTIVLVYLM
jgi:hypothetical protein